jgi:putative effector of murein hydrolase LrgA (UPF0299 family)
VLTIGIYLTIKIGGFIGALLVILTLFGAGFVTYHWFESGAVDAITKTLGMDNW